MPQQFEAQTEQNTSRITADAPSLSGSLSPPTGEQVSLAPSHPAIVPSRLDATPRAEATTIAAKQVPWPLLLRQWQQANRAPLFRFMYRTGLGPFLVSLPLMYIGLLFPLPPGVRTALLFAWGLFCIVALSAAFLSSGGLTPVQMRVLADLDQVEDVQAVGALLEAWQGAVHKQGQERLANILTCLLHRLRETDADLLTAPQRAILYGILTNEMAARHPDLVLVCLAAVEQIGDRRVLPRLARLIVRDAPTHNEQQARERAKAAVATLLNRLDFGTVEDIPRWIACLPSVRDAGVHWDDGMIAMYALTRLLPQLKPENTRLLNGNARRRLVEGWSALYPSASNGGTIEGINMQFARLGPDFRLAVLEAFRQIGTGQDAQTIRHWAYSEAPSEDARLVREKAREILPLLEALLEKEEAGRTLLRGASAPPTAPGELLRPAPTDHARSAPEELLRPMEADESREAHEARHKA